MSPDAQNFTTRTTDTDVMSLDEKDPERQSSAPVDRNIETPLLSEEETMTSTDEDSDKTFQYFTERHRRWYYHHALRPETHLPSNPLKHLSHTHLPRTKSLQDVLGYLDLLTPLVVFPSTFHHC